MTETARLPCLDCLRPLKTCLCKHVRRVKNRVELIILQHPLEMYEAKNSARLLHLCATNSQIFNGEVFNDEFFTNIIAPDLSIYNVLLYPAPDNEKSLGILPPPALSAERLTHEDPVSGSPLVRLWVLDATWRKSRKMLYLNSHLQAMPRLHLTECPPSIYSIRKAHNENQLSTLEAACYALQQLENNRVNYMPVLNAFAAFIREQKTFLPTHGQLDTL